jgi:hypothetical protein
MSYKRNQVEEAVGRIFQPDSKKPDTELLTRVKRLLELDRVLGRKRRSHDPEEANFAFFSEEAPGTGTDISFSEYEAFAVLNGLRIMQHGWPQSFAVSILRRMRADLERQHARILMQDPDILFDQEQLRGNAHPSDFGVDNTDPVFLTIVTSAKHTPTPEFAVCRGRKEVDELSRDWGASIVTTFELTTLTHQLRKELMKTAPRRRGRQ